MLIFSLAYSLNIFNLEVNVDKNAKDSHQKVSSEDDNRVGIYHTK